MPNSSGLIQIKRDLIKIGGTSLTAADWTAILKALIDDSIKGILRSIGDAGDTPSNITGKTLLKILDDLYNRVRCLDPKYGTQVLKHGNTSGTLVLYTVPSGKTLYITHCWLATHVSDSKYGDIYIRDTDDNLAYILLMQRSSSNCSALTNSATYLKPIEVPSGYDIVLFNSEGANLVMGGFTGWIE